MKSIAQKYRQHKAGVHRAARYLAVGGWNTLFGMAVYALLYERLHHRVNYLVLLVPANILAITNTYICYKLFVFKTSGNVLREYLKFYVVYGGTALLGFGLMFILVDGFGLHPVPAQVCCVPITIVLSYFSHRDYSFRAPKDKAGGAR
ncbi:MAG: GtrA family protein [Elusimicrobiales bacterium]|nr:GtrA family protein [Elusimicrobiales bacterium]